ncbi:hypothetical protein BJ508DRAFT_312713 [Ascobolus immersus RN42]|uniref:Uncharacterized protein n=1 Tax=Ascobolus immersus RN42 TaxID=1160509 RepID=A0A3N4HRD6_ASCIM|nr:hypothetical protein BJ508DRAFT_312713 [Ascobolus immersus RN42]
MQGSSIICLHARRSAGDLQNRRYPAVDFRLPTNQATIVTFSMMSLKVARTLQELLGFFVCSFDGCYRMQMQILPGVKLASRHHQFESALSFLYIRIAVTIITQMQVYWLDTTCFRFEASVGSFAARALEDQFLLLLMGDRDTGCRRQIQLESRQVSS